jgi:hypothetical protein
MMKEPNMPDNDLQIRTLLTEAASDVPPGIDLLSGFRARRAARRVRGRGRIALGTAVAGVLAATTTLTLTITTAPSALAELTSAVSATAGESYDFSATLASVPLPAGGPVPSKLARVSGAFDPARRTGQEMLGGGGQLRFIGRYAYLRPPAGSPAIPGAKSWVRTPDQPLWERTPGGQGLTVPGGPGSVAETNPQNLLALLKSASTVDHQGSASGDGWTGTSYTFTARITFNPAGNGQPVVTAAGTVGVDQEGRVRHFDATYTLPAAGSSPPQRVTVATTFSDFGTPVSVSPPPGHDVFIPVNDLWP